MSLPQEIWENLRRYMGGFGKMSVSEHTVGTTLLRWNRYILIQNTSSVQEDLYRRHDVNYLDWFRFTKGGNMPCLLSNTEPNRQSWNQSTRSKA